MGQGSLLKLQNVILINKVGTKLDLQLDDDYNNYSGDKSVLLNKSVLFNKSTSGSGVPVIS